MTQRVLIGCEFSGIVRRAFMAEGFDAWSCDLLPAEDGSNQHIVGDLLEVLDEGWDMLFVAHPPCTRLCNSGVRWLSDPPGQLDVGNYTPDEVEAYKAMTVRERLDFMWFKLQHGADFFSKCLNAPIEHVACENPVMHKHARERIENYVDPQIVQPWWFGDPQFKATGLYRRKLPPLVATDRLTPPARGTDEHKAWSRVHRMSRGKNRGKERSRFFPGIAKAMAAQWGKVIRGEA